MLILRFLALVFNLAGSAYKLSRAIRRNPSAVVGHALALAGQIAGLLAFIAAAIKAL
jgi:hypothetical protein